MHKPLSLSILLKDLFSRFMCGCVSHSLAVALLLKRVVKWTPTFLSGLNKALMNNSMVFRYILKEKGKMLNNFNLHTVLPAVF